MQLNIISLFTGTAQLDLGAQAALRAMGYETRVIAYVEYEPAAQRIIRARIRDGFLEDAPVWSDVRTFPGAKYRGHVDAIVGGFPCQDLSVAGRGAGIGKETRSGLFFEMLRVAVDSGCPLILMENVPGIGSTGAPIPDGGITNAAAVVAAALAEAGYLHKWVHLAAGDIGAPHGRERWWCIAFLDDTERHGLMDDAGLEEGPQPPL